MATFGEHQSMSSDFIKHQSVIDAAMPSRERSDSYPNAFDSVYRRLESCFQKKKGMSFSQLLSSLRRQPE